MDPIPPSTPETNPAPGAVVEPQARPLHFLRRHALKALCGTVTGGVLGYAGYPWVAGDRRDEMLTALEKFWDRIKENPRARGRSRVVDGRVREVPLTLDAHGREYQTFLTGLGLRYLKPHEILKPHFKQRGTVMNSLPPKELWRNLAPTLRVADELRQQLGVKLLWIASAYRSPAYNAACPGAATSSFHTQNMALDLVYDCAPEHVVKAAEALRAKGSFSGGIGRYASFTHVDTRGRNADW